MCFCQLPLKRRVCACARTTGGLIDTRPLWLSFRPPDTSWPVPVKVASDALGSSILARALGARLDSMNFSMLEPVMSTTVGVLLAAVAVVVAGVP